MRKKILVISHDLVKKVNSLDSKIIEKEKNIFEIKKAYGINDDRTCNNWTSNANGNAQIGHSDRVGNGNTSWNSANTTNGCSQSDLVSYGSIGLFYCFAID